MTLSPAAPTGGANERCVVGERSFELDHRRRHLVVDLNPSTGIVCRGDIVGEDGPDDLATYRTVPWAVAGDAGAEAQIVGCVVRVNSGSARFDLRCLPDRTIKRTPAVVDRVGRGSGAPKWRPAPLSSRCGKVGLPR